LKHLRSLVIAISLLVGSVSGASAQDFFKGLKAAQSGDFPTALQEWRPLAEQGDSDAQFNLGSMYSTGQGVLQDDAEAARWYRLAAEQGFADAQFNLGVRYSNGKGVPQDYAEAVKWYRLAAEQGEDNAQNNLAGMYQLGNFGNGILQSNVMAHMWYNIASANGSSRSGERRDALVGQMTNADISKAQQMASDCMNSNYQNCGN
jgi:TPR repeat protein